MTTPDECPDYPCRVCGYDLEEPPWGPDGASPSYLICDCCGAEAGLDDIDRAAATHYRDKWLADGARWFDPRARPPDWDVQAQLACVPPEFRAL